MAVDAVSSTSGTSSTTASGKSASEMSSADFYKLLIAELQYQDPFEPMDNAKMVEQMASIRNMESSASLTKALESVTRQQNFGTASTMIGKAVTGEVTDSMGEKHEISGVVSRVHFESDGDVILELEGGTQLPLESVVLVQERLDTDETSSQTTITKLQKAK